VIGLVARRIAWFASTTAFALVTQLPSDPHLLGEGMRSLVERSRP
jgi:hypothetical protein